MRFARTFTKVMLTGVLILLALVGSCAAIRSYLGAKLETQLHELGVSMLQINKFEFTSLERTAFVPLSAGHNRVVYRVKGLSHPELAVPESAIIWLEVEDYGDWKYRPESFDLIWYEGTTEVVLNGYAGSGL